MAANQNEENLDEPKEIPQATKAEEVSPTIGTTIIKTNEDTAKMEVHHHAHHEHGKRHWKSYFWEFLMLFLAVICAYSAESYHNYSINKDIEKRNIEMVVDNLKKDAEQLAWAISRNEQKLALMDTILSFQSIQDTDTMFTQKFGELIFQALPLSNFYSNSAAIDQMKSSGSLRLIADKNVLEHIYNYERINKFLEHHNDSQSNYSRNIMESLGSFMILYDDNLPRSIVNHKKRLKSTDEAINRRQDIFVFYNQVRTKKFVMQTLYVPQLKLQLKNAETLLQLLQKEYELEES